MLEQITWSTYWTAVIILLLLYYLMIGVLYFRGDLPILIRKLNRKRMSGGSKAGEDSAPASPGIETLQEKVQQINSIFKDAGGQADKQALLGEIGRVLTGFEGLERPAFKAALSNHIIREAEEQCGVDLTESELERTWGNLS